ncbi:MAG: glycosyltransferase family 39 protein [Acidobacteria bacterium]|nr:glycosyltransferase family 39 protein [Acidobacteriota bacterium]
MGDSEIQRRICAILILLLIYWPARQLMTVWEAALATGLVLVICAIKSTANFIQPYAYAALYGLVFALASLVCTVRFMQDRRQKGMVWAGVFAGLSLISKPELALAALAAAGAALLMESVSSRKSLAREALFFIAPVIVIVAVA